MIPPSSKEHKKSYGLKSSCLEMKEILASRRGNEKYVNCRKDAARIIDIEEITPFFPLLIRLVLERMPIMNNGVGSKTRSC